MQILRFIAKTAGGNHAWFEAEHAGTKFRVRKPDIGDHIDFWKEEDPKLSDEWAQTQQQEIPTPWSRVRAWIAKLWNAIATRIGR